MSKKDKHHQQVRTALEKDGWTITNDPLVVPVGIRKVNVDLGAERLLAAEKGKEKIAVEIKTFTRTSMIYDFYGALGQFRFYLRALAKTEPDRILFLAVSKDVYEDFFDETFIREVVELENLKMMVYSIIQEKIEKWIK